MPDDVMTLTRTATKLGHTSAKQPIIVAGRRDFFTYRDLDRAAPAAARCAVRS